MFADKYDKELGHYHGSLEKDSRKHEGIKEFHKLDADTSSHPVDKDIPKEIDWRDYGAVSPVGGQGICGACYAFTAAGAVEGAWYRKTSKMVHLSKQQLVDCSWGTGNHGCKGGHYAAALSWVYVHGISTSKSYGKYLGQEGYCHFNDTWFGANIEGFTYVPAWNATALKRTIAMHGPVAVSINTMPMSFKFYSKGIYSDSKCSKNTTTHSALVIGYGKENGEEYWIVKNSWSSFWGENGYIRVAMKDDLCGITEYPVAVIVKHPSFHLPQNKNEEDDHRYDGNAIKEKDAERLPKEDEKNIPANPSGGEDSNQDIPGNLDKNGNHQRNFYPSLNINTNQGEEDDEDDEDEQVDKQNKVIASSLHHYNQHQQHQNAFEKSLQRQSPIAFKGLHIEDIGNDIKKIHQLLVNTAQADQVGLGEKTLNLHGLQDDKNDFKDRDVEIFSNHPESKSNVDVIEDVVGSNTRTLNSVHVSAYRGGSLGHNNNNNVNTKSNTKKKGKKSKSKVKSSTKTVKSKRKKQPDKKKSSNQKDLINELIKKLDSDENPAKKTRIHQKTTKKTTASATVKTLNPEKIGSLSRNTKRSKTASHSSTTIMTSKSKGTKRTMITRLDEKQKLQRQQRLAKKKKKRSKLENRVSSNNSPFSKVSPTTRGSKRSRVTGRRKSYGNYYNESPVRRTMDIHFFGLPSSSVNQALWMENRALRREFRPKRTHKKRSSSHKRDELKQSAMDIAKQDSMDSIYSFIDKRVHDISTHASKKHDINYYKHHIHNG